VVDNLEQSQEIGTVAEFGLPDDARAEADGEPNVERSDEADRPEEGENEPGYEPLEPAALVAAVLFSTSRPLRCEAIATLTELDAGEVERALVELTAIFTPRIHGFSLVEVNGGYQLRTAHEAAKTIRKLLHTRTRRLSRAAAETLAVIAYKQPVTRAAIEAIRGVDALPTLKTLIEQKLINIVGQESSIGQPALYGTTELFLERFGLKDLDGLPSERELVQLENEPGEGASTDSEAALDDDESSRS